MRYVILLVILLVSCSESVQHKPFNSVKIETIYSDSISIRAIELMGNNVAFAANKGTFGTVDLISGKIRANVQKYHTGIPAFRSVAHTSTDFFMLSIESPALLYKIGDSGRMEIVYKEEGEDVFYDAMTFLNDMDGIIDFGASPRATINLVRSAKARAFVEGRGYVTPEDVRYIGHDILRHRIILTYEAEAEELTSDLVIDRLFEKIEVP